MHEVKMADLIIVIHFHAPVTGAPAPCLPPAASLGRDHFLSRIILGMLDKGMQLLMPIPVAD